jgi:DHA2 family multidrug resistance protein
MTADAGLAPALTSPVDETGPDTAAEETVPLRSWLAVVGGTIGAFMAVINVQTTNASLEHIQGSLSANLDEGSWISTAYLTAEIVAIPLSAWLCRLFSLRRYILVNTALFLLFSVLCALAWDLHSMIVFRVLSGFTGGVMIPVSFMLILRLLPAPKRALGFALFGLSVTLAPCLGPTIGGWLTENYGWQWIFYLQIVPGALMFAAFWHSLECEPMKLHLLGQGDWVGILSMAIGLGALTIVLEEGNRRDWLSSDFIVRGIVIAVLALIVFVLAELRRGEPLVNLRLLRRRNFAIASAIGLFFGLGLFGSIYLIALYLIQVQGYNPLHIGEVMMWIGIPQLLVFPIVLRATNRVDHRWLLALGIALFSLSCFMNVNMTHDSAYWQLVSSNVVRAIGQPFIMLPLSMIAIAGIERQQSGSASSLYNGVRMLGGTIGISLLGTCLTTRQHFHSNHALEFISSYERSIQERLATLTRHFLEYGTDPELARSQALAAISDIARRETLVMAYNDVFYLMGAAFLLSLVLVPLLKDTGAKRRLPPRAKSAVVT